MIDYFMIGFLFSCMFIVMGKLLGWKITAVAYGFIGFILGCTMLIMLIIYNIPSLFS